MVVKIAGKPIIFINWENDPKQLGLESGPRQKINTQPCLSFGPSTALHPPAHIHKYALADAPCIRTKIRRNLAHLFFAEILSVGTCGKKVQYWGKCVKSV
jgi:hypothetical protein